MKYILVFWYWLPTEDYHCNTTTEPPERKFLIDSTQISFARQLFTSIWLWIKTQKSQMKIDSTHTTWTFSGMNPIPGIEDTQQIPILIIVNGSKNAW